MLLSCYESEDCPAELESVEPIWPTLAFEEILNIAFKNRIIDSDSHPIIRGLQGKI